MGHRLRIALLGGFRAALPSGEPIALASRRARALLAYLAARPGQAHERDTLATLLWGDAGASRARHSLRQVLVGLRRALPRSSPPVLVEAGRALALRPGAADVDLEAFERLAAQGTTAALAEAASLYRGDLLEGLDAGETPFEDWLRAERERLREAAIAVLRRLLSHHEGAEDSQAAVQVGARLLALDPAQEAVHRTLMRLHAGQGRRGAALRQYQLCAGALERELGLEPEAETRRLYQDILRRPATPSASPARVRAFGPGRARPGPAPSSRRTTPAAELPTPDTPLVGREAEVAELRALLDGALAGRGRLALLLGEAGIGKTRLAAETVAVAAARGARPLLGRCHESAQILPFGPWVDALRAGRALDECR